jgi:choline monooxygenase
MRTVISPLSQDKIQQLHAVQQPLRRASTLPPWCYASQEWYELEAERIFFKEWLSVGLVEQVPNPGDYFSVDLLGEPIVIVRDKDGTIRALSAVCRHRGAPVVQGEGHCNVFQCPYHSWTYGLDGELLATPGRPRPMDDVENFDKNDYSLVSFKVDSWGGLLFVNFDPDAQSLATWLGTLPGFLQNYQLETMRSARRKVYDLACNWKAFLETVIETYHVETVHKKHIDPNDVSTRIWTAQECDGPFEAIYSKSGLADVRGRSLPKLNGLSEAQLTGSYHLWLHPNLTISPYSHSVVYRQMLPEGPHKTKLITTWCYPPFTLARPDFDEITAPLYPPADEVDLEDIWVSELAQKGYGSRYCRQGRYSPREELAHRIALYVIDRVMGS